MVFHGGHNILKAIDEEVKNARDKKGLNSTFIIIHEEDVPALITEMQAAKMLPSNPDTGKLVIGSSRVIRTRDISKGFIAVVGI